MNLKLSRIYRGDTFIGLGLAVDGELLPYQVSTEQRTTPSQPPSLTVEFILHDSMLEDAPDVYIK